MKLIKSDASLIQEENPYKKVELIGRTCYKSEDKITDDSCYKFVTGLIKRSHFAMLEHARFTFALDCIPHMMIESLFNVPGVIVTPYRVAGGTCPDTYFVSVSMSHLYNQKWRAADSVYHTVDLSDILDSMLVLVVDKWGNESVDVEGLQMNISSEHIYLVDSIIEEYLQGHMDIDDVYLHSSMTIKFICDRGVSHELVRHRVSFAQESTRYCNYTLGKFGGECVFIYPANFKSWSAEMQEAFRKSIIDSEYSYMKLSECGATPQQARAVLPNALKTEVIMTSSFSQLQHFFNMRSLGTTGAPHPDMKVVADIARKEVINYVKELGIENRF